MQIFLSHMERLRDTQIRESGGCSEIPYEQNDEGSEFSPLDSCHILVGTF
jgi:hypothetical protein